MLATIFVTIFALLPFYLLGAFPTGRLVARAYGVAIEKEGSGNVGATNVARVVGKKAGLLTLGGDLLKGLLAVLIARIIWGEGWLVASAGAAAVLGHCFSIPGKLKGGKGVATALGVTLGLSPLCALGGVLTFAFVLSLSRTVSIASITAALTVPIIAAFLNPNDAVAAALAIVGLVIVYRHRENIDRIIAGTEAAFSLGKKS